MFEEGGKPSYGTVYNLCHNAGGDCPLDCSNPRPAHSRNNGVINKKSYMYKLARTFHDLKSFVIFSKFSTTASCLRAILRTFKTSACPQIMKCTHVRGTISYAALTLTRFYIDTVWKNRVKINAVWKNRVKIDAVWKCLRGIVFTRKSKS